uniref:Uncharacterized protein n=1 Tax=Leptospira ellisii TaxID=2023197 RepID=A0A2N0B4W0_9LEPT|nr:hypothetical protein CH379_17785 [Leptospira ellisii]
MVYLRQSAHALRFHFPSAGSHSNKDLEAELLQNRIDFHSPEGVVHSLFRVIKKDPKNIFRKFGIIIYKI